MSEPRSSEEWQRREEEAEREYYRRHERELIDGFTVDEYARRQTDILESWFDFGGQDPDVVTERRPATKEDYWDFTEEELHDDAA